jgi:hypothetical protein
MSLPNEIHIGKPESVQPPTPRLRVWLRTIVTGNQAPMEQTGWILDLSSEGCQIEAPHVVQESALLALRIFVPDLDWPIMVDGAVVQNVEGNTFHVHFLRMTPGEAERLAGVMGRIAQDGESAGALDESNRAEVPGLSVAGNGERLRRRLPLSCRVFFFGDDDYEGEGKMLDISTSGCRIASDERLPVGKVLKLSLFLKDHQWPMRIDEAIVRWAKEGTYGIEFTSIRLAQRERIRAMVMKHRS